MATARAWAWPGPGAQHDELADAVETRLRYSATARRRACSPARGRAHVAVGALVGAVGGPLQQAELLEVAGDRGLGGVDAAAAQLPAQGLLAEDGLAVDELEDGGLSERLHVYAADCIRYHTAGDRSTRRRARPRARVAWLAPRPSLSRSLTHARADRGVACSAVDRGRPLTSRADCA